MFPSCQVEVTRQTSARGSSMARLVTVMTGKLCVDPPEDGPFLTLTGVLVPAVSVRTWGHPPRASS